jgi:hypothetical protein
MGIDYSFDVYVHQRDTYRFLTQVAALCDRHDGPWTTVVLPNNTSLRMPGTLRFEAGRTATLTDELEASHHLTFDLSLCFPQDDPLRGYRDDDLPRFDWTRVWPDGTTRIAMGLIYLSVFDGSALMPGHRLFSFTPATSRQSRLFLSSPSIRETFATLASSVAAPLCLLDVEESHDIVVTTTDRRISTQIPGPCVLWNRRAPKHEAYRELLARLDSRSSAAAPRWIIGPEHPDYAAFVAELTHHSQVSGAVC